MRNAGSSSTTITSAPPTGPAMRSGAVSGAGAASSPSRHIGSEKNSRVPRPSPSLRTPITPPISSTRLRVIASPSPVPPNFRVVLPSAWVNFSKIISWRSRGIPIPVSTTSNMMCPSSGCAMARTRIEPSGVNLMLLPTRFTSTCFILPASARAAGIGSDSTSKRSSRPFCAAWTWVRV